MRIIDLRAEDRRLVREAATLLAEGLPAGWPDLAAALAEGHESLAEGHISRVALADDGAVVGWIGARSTYDGNVWGAPSPRRARDLAAPGRRPRAGGGPGGAGP